MRFAPGWRPTSALWRIAGTDGLSELFTGDATYSMAPYSAVVRVYVSYGL